MCVCVCVCVCCVVVVVVFLRYLRAGKQYLNHIVQIKFHIRVKSRGGLEREGEEWRVRTSERQTDRQREREGGRAHNIMFHFISYY